MRTNKKYDRTLLKVGFAKKSFIDRKTFYRMKQRGRIFPLALFFSQYLMFLILLNDRQNRFNIVFWFVQIFAERAYKRKIHNAWKFIESLHIIHMYTQANRERWSSSENWCIEVRKDSLVRISEKSWL